MTGIDTLKIADLLREAASTYILPRYKALEDHDVVAKTNPRDLVTQADLDVERHLSEVLPRIHAGSFVVGEEGAYSDPESLKALQQPRAMVWVIDPVDGTHNFVHHKREFGLMLACVENGETTHAWIYDVLGQEMFIAARGAGAYAWKNGQSERLRVDPCDVPALAKGFVNPGYFPKPMREQLKAGMNHFTACVSLNCAAHEYMRLSRGQASFALYGRLKPWDHLPGALMVEEAGGVVRLADGRDYKPSGHDAGLIVANNETICEAVMSHFIRSAPGA